MPIPHQPIEPPIRAELRVQTVCLSILTVVAVGFGLYWLRPVMIPFVVAAFLSFALMPLVDMLEVHGRIPRTIAVCVALLLAVLGLVGFGMLASTAVAQIAGSAGDYQAQLEKLLEKTITALPLDKVMDHPQDLLKPLSDMPEGTVQTLLLGATNAMLGIVSQSAIVLVFMFFLLSSSVKRDRPIGGAWGEMEAQIRAYLLTMSALSAVCGLLVGVVLGLLGVQAAVLFGLLTFLLNFIPNVGSFIATLLPLPIVLLSPQFTTAEAIAAIAIPGAIQFIIGNFIQPNVMGSSMKMHPVTILLSLIFWGMIWGIVGMFLAVPTTSMIKIACEQHGLTRPVAHLMAGRLDALREEPIIQNEVA